MVSKGDETGAMWLSGDFEPGTFELLAAVVREGMSVPTETTVDAICADKTKPEDLLGQPLHIAFEAVRGAGAEKTRTIRGICTSVETRRVWDGFYEVRLETRPRLWLLTLTKNSRIFQDKSTLDILAEVLGDHGLSDYQDLTKESYPARPYCVQYRESDFDFICRLLEEEGIYYHFDHSGEQEKLVIADGSAAHKPIDFPKPVPFATAGSHVAEDEGWIYEWAPVERIRTGKISLVDYDFTKPSADLSVTTEIRKGKHPHGTLEAYDTPGHYSEVGRGETLSRIRAEEAAHGAQRAAAMTTVRSLAPGVTFTMSGNEAVPEKDEFLVLSATHFLVQSNDLAGMDLDRFRDTPEQFLVDIADAAAARRKEEALQHRSKRGDDDSLPEPEADYRCLIEVADKAEPFRPPRVTPWPAISGLQTAVVTGPSGEEIHTDEHGRIKVQFHWDRDGQKDEKTTCWVRAVVPWSGKGWGIAAIPRIGQEVVIQFEEGDPDRPICTGMLYNGTNKPPYGLPANKTQTGIKTNSSKGGNGFNELMFEDKKDSELVRFQSETDYRQIVKNNAEITIGLEKKDKGDLTQTIHGSKTETLKTGDHTFTVEDGNETVKIKKDRTKTIEGKSTETITKDTSLTVLQGNLTETINTGNASRTVKMGNDSLTTNVGNVSVNAKAGKVTITAALEILLKVGQSSIKIDNTGVTVSGLMVKVDAKAMSQTKAPLTMINGNSAVMVRGGTILLN